MGKKISIIGAGFVGATTAFTIAERNLGDIVLVDIVESVFGKTLDMQQAMSGLDISSKIKGTTDYEDIKDSDIVIITAGFPRKPGMTRDDLLNKNSEIIKKACENVKKYAPNSILIVVTNPLDVMAYLAYKTTGFDKKRVLGMAGVLDSARFKTFLAESLDVPVKDIDCMVLGSHGDSMVSLINHTTVSGTPIKELLSEEKFNSIAERTKNGGAEIVKYLGSGSAYYAPAISIVLMVEALIMDKKIILPVSAMLEGEYGFNDIFLGVPVKLGKNGVEKIIEIKLSDDEKAKLDASAKIMAENIRKL
jgi:malate dehydrogenase